MRELIQQVFARQFGGANLDLSVLVVFLVITVLINTVFH